MTQSMDDVALKTQEAKECTNLRLNDDIAIESEGSCRHKQQSEALV